MEQLKIPTLGDICRRAAKLIRGGWTTGTLARTESGWKVSARDPDAASFCMAGALIRATGDLGGPFDAYQEVARLQRAKFTDSIPAFNDFIAKDANAVAERLEKLGTLSDG